MALGILKNLTELLIKASKEAFSKEQMTIIGQEVIEIIKRRTRLGYGVDRAGEKRRSLRDMRRHNPIYTEARKALAKDGKLSSMTAPTKHNLTLTGDMLDSMKIKKAETNKVTIDFNGEDNKMKAGVNEKRGWKFLNLSDNDLKQLQRILANNLEVNLRKIRLLK
jgi:hypothetical protein